MQDRLALQANIHLLIARAEVLRIEKLDYSNQVILDLIKTYRSWFNAEQIEQGMPNYPFIHKLNERNPDLTLYDLERNFQANWDPEFTQHSIAKLTEHLNKKDITLPEGKDLPTYKKSLFEIFLYNTLPAKPDAEFFKALRTFSQTIGYSNFEYNTLLSHAAANPSFTKNIKDYDEKLNAFLKTRNYIMAAAGLLTTIPTILITSGIISKLIPSLAAPEALSLLDTHLPKVNTLCLLLTGFLSTQMGDKHEYQKPLLVVSNLLSTTLLCYINRHSTGLQCAIVGLGIAKISFTLFSNNLVEYATTTAEKA